MMNNKRKHSRTLSVHNHKKARHSTCENGNETDTDEDSSFLDNLDDLGIEPLDNDSETEDVLFKRCRLKKIQDSSLLNTPDSTIKEIAITEATLPDNTMAKLCLGELDHLLESHVSSPSDGRRFSVNNPFDMLSDEVILYILRKISKHQLSNVALVCRRFSQLVEDESLWTRLDICNRKLAKGVCGQILSRQVLVLRMARCNISYPVILKDSKAWNEDFTFRLMYLDLSMSSISAIGLCAIFNKCRYLKKLSLENVPVTNDVLKSLSVNQELEVLNFAMCLGLESEGLKHLLESCRKIRELNMAWTYLSPNSITFICNNLPPTLTRFNFSGCRKDLLDDDVKDLVSCCPLLKELDLSDCTAISQEAICFILPLEHLNCLAISRCYHIPLPSLVCLRSMKNLCYLEIHGSYVDPIQLKFVNEGLGPQVEINKFKFSSIARPTLGMKRNSIWNMSVEL